MARIGLRLTVAELISDIREINEQNLLNIVRLMETRNLSIIGMKY